MNNFNCRRLNANADHVNGVEHGSACEGPHGVCAFDPTAPTACPFGGCSNCDDSGYYDECADEAPGDFGRVDMWELSDADSYNQ